ncbi:MAG TPA: PorV/PorQ family protein [archaeon]|nr:PorV/PorQ family protein [archaeon]
MWLTKNKAEIAGLLAILLFPALLAAATAGVSNPLRGRVADFSNVGNRAADFLTIPVGARGIAMGNAFVAQADDISSVYWNPAGLSFIEGPQVFFSHLDMPVDFSLEYAAAAMPLLDGRLVIGGFFGILNIAEEEITTIEFPNGTGSYYDGYSLQFGGSLAFNFSDRFSAGFSVKAVRESIYQLCSTAAAFDMGTNYHTELFEKPIRVSFAITNLGTNMRFSGENLFLQVKPQELYSDRLQDGAGNRMFNRDNRNAYYSTNGFYLPTSFMAGVSMDVYTTDVMRLTVAGQFAENNYMPSSFAFGTEFTRDLSNKFSGAMRFGWNVERDEVDLKSEDQLRGMSIGGGVEYRMMQNMGITIDYAYRDLGRLTQNHVFTLMWKMF